MPCLALDKHLWLTISIFFNFYRLSTCAPGMLKMDIRTSHDALLTRIDYQDGFNNIPQLIAANKNGNTSYTILCARGAFLLYDAPLYASVNGTIDGVSLLVSSDFAKCTPLADIGPLGSIRAVTVANYTRSQISLYASKNFMGRQLTIHKNKGKAQSMLAGSLVVIDKYKWMVVFDDLTHLCLIPKSENAVCLLSNIVDKKNVKVGATIKNVKRGCRPPNNQTVMKEVELSDCYDFGQGLVKPLKPSWPFGAPDAGGNNGSGDGKDCQFDDSKDILTDEQKYLIEGRLNGTIATGDWMARLEDSRNVWRTELFDKCLRVFMYVCDGSIIDPEYLILFASLYFHHLDKSWREGSEFKYVEFDEAEWMEMNHNMDECIEGVADGMYANNKLSIVAAIANYKDLKELTKGIDDLLGMRPKYDYILEINWMMANLVASVCHDIIGPTTNFVSKFWNVFHPLYFTPIEDVWEEPTNVTAAYKYIFGGYGMEKSFAKVGYCATSSMLAAHAMEPYPRPFEQKKEIFLPKYGEYDEDDARAKHRARIARERAGRAKDNTVKK